MTAVRPRLEPVARAISEAHSCRFVRRVSGGAFKEVYLIEGTDPPRQALKIIAGPSAAPRTAREIDVLSQCDHPSIARLIDVGRHTLGSREYDYSIEEFLDGGTLSERLGQTTVLSVAEVQEIGTHLIDALQHISSRGSVHRDIKPENIMFRDDSNIPIIVDFGLVRNLSDISLTQSWLARGPGTPYYASPEQLNNQKRLINWRSDQFSLGVTLAFARFQAHPYQLTSEPALAAETVNRVAVRGPVSPEFQQSVQDDSLHALPRMVAAWPVQRFRDATELAEAWESQEGD